MSRSRTRELTEEDRILWDMVVRSVTRTAADRPKAPESVPSKAEDQSPEAEKSKQINQLSLSSDLPAFVRTPRSSGTHLDSQTRGKLAKGRLPLEARVDLHGMRQDEAYGLLLSFLARAHARGVRYVLVITGKGSSSGGDGVLRRSVPGWLSTAPFRQYVSAHESAARGHGGSGALYVRLRRVRNP